MRSTAEDMQLLAEAGIFGEDPGKSVLFNFVVLTQMYAKRRHKMLRNPHKLAKAVERGDSRDINYWYTRMVQEAEHLHKKYPDLYESAVGAASLTDEQAAEIDRLFDEGVSPSRDALPDWYAEARAMVEDSVDDLLEKFGEGPVAVPKDAAMDLCRSAVLAALDEVGDERYVEAGLRSVASPSEENARLLNQEQRRVVREAGLEEWVNQLHDEFFGTTAP